MKTKKTPQAKRETYKLYDENGNLVTEYKPGENGITEVDILNLHRLDDHEVYINSKEMKLPEWYQPIYEQWRENYIANFIEKHGRKAHLNSGKGKTYSKFYGKPEHRVVAEAMLGRSLLPGEVVHHIDGNKRNNAANNLRVFSSQAEHVKFHAECDWFLKEIERLENEEGGDAK